MESQGAPAQDPSWSRFRDIMQVEEEAMGQMDKISLTATEDHYSDMLKSLTSCYKLKKFCDVKMICRDGATVLCHQLVLAALSDMLEGALRNVEDDTAVIMLPDIDSDSLIMCLDSIYNCQNENVYFGKMGVVKEVLDIISARHVQELFNFKLKSEKLMDVEEDSAGDLIKPKLSDFLEESMQECSDSEPLVQKPHHEAHRVKRTLNTKGLEEQANTLDAMMEEKIGTLFVHVNKCQDHSMPRLPSASQNDACYSALVGIKITDKKYIEALPLVWSPPTTPSDYHLVERLKHCGEVLKNIFGLSDIEVYGQLHIRTLFGAPRNKNLEHCVVQRELSQYDSSKLRALLEEPEMKNAAAIGLHKKSLTKTFNQDEEVALSFVKSLSVEEVNGAMLIVVHADGHVTGDILNPCFKQVWKRERKDAVCKELVQLFFKIALMRTGEKQCSGCPVLVNHYHHYAILKRRHDMANDYLRDESLKVNMAQTEICDICGKVFDMTDKGKALFVAHKRKHYYTSFKCDCPVKFTNVSEKKRHILLVHRKGFVQCDQCTFVGKLKTLPKHVEQFHHLKPTCEYCGITIRNKYILKDHVATHHPEKATAESLKKIELKGGICKYCGQFFKLLAKHIRDNCGRDKDSRYIECSDCGKSFTKRSLKTHIMLCHTPNDQLPFPCQQCDRR